MKSIIKIITYLILVFPILFSCNNISKEDYDKLNSENKKLKDSVKIFTEKFINGKEFFLSADSLFIKRKFLDAKNAIISFKKEYSKSNLLKKADSLLSEINKNADEILFCKTKCYQYFHNSYMSLNRRGGLSNANSYYSNGCDEFKNLQFVNNEKEIQELVDFINDSFKRAMQNYSPNDIGFLTFNAILGAKLEAFGNKIKIYELQNK